MNLPTGLIGIFDSGVGGFSVLRAIRELMPHQSIIYVADQAHVPYGQRQMEEIRNFSRGITHFLITRGASLIVVACNTASAAALHLLRQENPLISFVGMEPALKPATQTTQSRIVGVLATPATFQSELFTSVLERFAQDVTILKSTCPGLVDEIESGHLQSQKVRQILQNAIQPMLAAGADTLVLGCTHYPFVLHIIQEIAGPSIQVIDPSPAIARRIHYLLEKQNILEKSTNKGELTIFTTGDAFLLKEHLSIFLDEDLPVFPLRWETDKIVFI